MNIPHTDTSASSITNCPYSRMQNTTLKKKAKMKMETKPKMEIKQGSCESSKRCVVRRQPSNGCAGKAKPLRKQLGLRFRCLLFILLFAFAIGSKPIQNIQVTLKGDVFYISNVRTANELQQRLHDESGLDPIEQGQVTFQGKVLGPSDSLSEAGMRDGDQANIVPQSMAQHWKMIKDMGDGLLALKRNTRDKSNASPEDLQELAVMEQLFEQMTEMPYMQDQMESFAMHLRNPGTLARAAEFERAESLRQIILNNPLLLDYIRQSIGIEILNDSGSWYQHVQTCVKRWATMDGYELWQALLNNDLFGSGQEPPQG